MSRQALDRGIGVDLVIAADLGRDFGAKLDLQILNGTGANGQLLGLLTVTGTTSIAYTDASPTAVKALAKVFECASKTSTAFGAPIDTLVMHPKRSFWFASQSQTAATPYSPLRLPGNLVLAPAVPTGLGVSTDQDVILCLVASEVILYADPVRISAAMARRRLEHRPGPHQREPVRGRPLEPAPRGGRQGDRDRPRRPRHELLAPWGYFQSERRKSPRLSGPRASTFLRREVTTAVNVRASLDSPNTVATLQGWTPRQDRWELVLSAQHRSSSEASPAAVGRWGSLPFQVGSRRLWVDGASLLSHRPEIRAERFKSMVRPNRIETDHSLTAHAYPHSRPRPREAVRCSQLEGLKAMLDQARPPRGQETRTNRTEAGERARTRTEGMPSRHPEAQSGSTRHTHAAPLPRCLRLPSHHCRTWARCATDCHCGVGVEIPSPPSTLSSSSSHPRPTFYTGGWSLRNAKQRAWLAGCFFASSHRSKRVRFDL
jgi:Phage capsid family